MPRPGEVGDQAPLRDPPIAHRSWVTMVHGQC
jgi:hypothetical protein